MGTNIYRTKNPGDVISSDDPNQYKIGLTNDVIPRNLSGNVEDISGSLGSAFYRWLSSHIKTIFLGETDSNLEITETAGAFSFEIDGSPVAVIDSGGLDGSYIKAASITPAKRAPLNLVKSGTLSVNTSGTSITDLLLTPATGTVDCTITTSGRPVKVSLQGYTSGGSNFAYFSMTCTVSQNVAEARVYLYRNGSIVSSQTFRVATAVNNIQEIWIPASAISFIDEPAAGTHVYKVAVQKVTGNQVTANDIRLMVYEL